MSMTDDSGDRTDSDAAVFERLADDFEGEDVGEIAEAVLQSLDSEEANS